MLAVKAVSRLTPAQKAFLAALEGNDYQHFYDESKSGPAVLIEPPAVFFREIDTSWADRIMLSQLSDFSATDIAKIQRKKDTRNVLTREEEYALFVYYNSLRFRIHQMRNSGDNETLIRLWEESLRAENKITQFNLGLLLNISRQFLPKCKGICGVSEVFSCTGETMMTAIRLFDPYLGFKFSTYYYRGAFQKLGRELENGIRYRRRVRTVSSFVADDDTYNSIYANLAVAVDVPLYDKDMVATVRNIASGQWDMPDEFHLSDLERTALWFRFFGKGREGPPTLAEVGEHLFIRYGGGKSKERARQLLKTAMDKTRGFLESKKDPIKYRFATPSETETWLPPATDAPTIEVDAWEPTTHLM